MQRGFVPIIILVVLAIIVGAGGYFYYQQQKIKNINSFEECAKAGYPVMQIYPPRCNTPDGRSFTKELSEDEKEKLNPPQEDETANWKTYANTKYGYSIKYPDDLLDNCDKNELRLMKATSQEDDCTSYGEEFPVLLITYSLEGTGDIDKSSYEDCYAIKGESVILSGIQATKYSSIIKSEKDKCALVSSYAKYTIHTIINHKDQIYNISYNEYENADLKNKILSTFKFLDQENETAGWKIYTNSQYSFSVKYPSGWVVYEYPVDTRYKLLNLVITSKEKDINLSSDANPRIGFTVNVNTNLHGQDIFQKSGADKDPNFVGFSYEQTIFLGLPASRSYMIWSDIIPDQGISWLYVNNNSYGWILGWPNTDLQGHYDQVYKQILSTFKFLDQGKNFIIVDDTEMYCQKFTKDDCPTICEVRSINEESGCHVKRSLK